VKEQDRPHDPTLVEVDRLHDLIVSKYSKRTKRNEARCDALAYAQASLIYAQTHHGEVLGPDDEDYSAQDALEWSVAIENATCKKWSPMKKKLFETSRTFLLSEWDGDNKTAKAFLNLSRSV